MNRPTDTSPDVERRLIEAYRRMPVARKWQNLVQDYALARMLHAAGMRQRRPGVTNAEIQADWIAATLGFPPPFPVREPAMEFHFQSFQSSLREVIRVLDRMGIAYAIGGSIACSFHGIGRMTRDADLTAEPFPGREAEFVRHFDPVAYYLPVEAVQDAIRGHSSFNVLHLDSGFKIDLFIRKDEPFEQSAFARRLPMTLPDVPEEPVLFYTAEDTVLFKLRWYRLGNEISDRQWNDVLGVLRAQAGRLDDAYLDRWAAEIGVGDLLARARQEAALP